jgi:hypothetical protein
MLNEDEEVEILPAIEGNRGQPVSTTSTSAKSKKRDSSQIDPSLIRTMVYLFGRSSPDTIALRFLRARNWDIDAAIKMFTDCMHWRTGAKIDDILYKGETVIPQWLNESAYAVTWQKDKVGRPIVWLNATAFRKDAAPLEENSKHTIWAMETIKNYHLNESVADSVTVVCDLKGVGYSHIVCTAELLCDIYDGLGLFIH